MSDFRIAEIHFRRAHESLQRELPYGIREAEMAATTYKAVDHPRINGRSQYV